MVDTTSSVEAVQSTLWTVEPATPCSLCRAVIPAGATALEIWQHRRDGEPIRRAVLHVDCGGMVWLALGRALTPLAAQARPNTRTARA